MIKIIQFINVAIITIILIIFLIPFPKDMIELNDVSSIVFLDRNKNILREKLNSRWERSNWIKINDIPQFLLKSLLINEDSRFYDHSGVDGISTIRAFIQNISALKIVSGGSTITQQLTKAIYRSKRNIFNKAIESILSLQLEICLSKEEILEQYFNRAPYGNQCFGIETASRFYFNKSVKDLTIQEGTFLSVIPQLPTLLDPYENKSAVQKKQKALLKKLLKAGIINNEEYNSTENSEITLSSKRSVFAAPHFIEYIIKQLDKETLNRSAIIETTLDGTLQQQIEHIVKPLIKKLEDKGVTNASVVVIDNETSEIRAMLGSVDYFDKSTFGNINGATAERQPGSALKPFAYLLALDRGFNLSSVIPDIEVHYDTENGNYSPKNYDLLFHGPVRLRMALANSLNIPAVRITDKIGYKVLYDKLVELGVKSFNYPADHYGLGLVLGNGELSLCELTYAYSTIARLGEKIPLKYFSNIYDANQHLILNSETDDRKRVFSSENCYLISDAISDNEARAPTFSDHSPLNMPFQTAVKTGTSKNYKDNWTVGFTSKYTVGVWVGDFGGKAMHNVSGVTGAGPIFRKVMIAVNGMTSQNWYHVPENLVSLEICPLSGLLRNQYCEGSTKEIYVKGSEPTEKCDFHKLITVDTRNNLLAGRNCPNEFKRDVLYIDFPQEYNAWAKDKGYNLPPKTYSDFCKNDLDNATTGKITILFPNNNDSFFLDETIPENYQTLSLKAKASDGIKTIDWYIDEHKIDTTSYPFTTRWKPTVGDHKIYAMTDYPVHYKSKTVRITVKK